MVKLLDLMTALSDEYDHITRVEISPVIGGITALIYYYDQLGNFTQSRIMVDYVQT